MAYLPEGEFYQQGDGCGGEGGVEVGEDYRFAAACEEVLPVVAVVTLLLGERVKMTKAIAATMSTAIKMMMFRF